MTNEKKIKVVITATAITRFQKKPKKISKTKRKKKITFDKATQIPAKVTPKKFSYGNMRTFLKLIL